MDRDALAEFLRRRREALTPAEVGVLTGPRRRTRGLRREEVAQLTGMSVDYYSRLEQRRGPQPSVQMLSALARALRLDLDERDHLFRLVGHATPDRYPALATFVRPTLLHVLDKLDDCAAFIVSDLDVMLAQNRLSVLLLGDHREPTGVGFRASMTWKWFTDNELRSRHPAEEHDHQGRLGVANLRATWSRRHGDADVECLVAELLAASEEFRLLWERHEVGLRHDIRKGYQHPRIGRMTVDIEHMDAGRGQRLVVFSAAPASESYSKMQLLATLGDQTVGDSTVPG